MTKRREREAQCASPANTEGERAQRQHGLAAGMFPSRTGAPHSHEALAGGFDVTAADRKSRSSRIDVAHAVRLVDEVDDRVMPSSFFVKR